MHTITREKLAEVSPQAIENIDRMLGLHITGIALIAVAPDPESAILFIESEQKGIEPVGAVHKLELVVTNENKLDVTVTFCTGDVRLIEDTKFIRLEHFTSLAKAFAPEAEG